MAEQEMMSSDVATGEECMDIDDGDDNEDDAENATRELIDDCTEDAPFHNDAEDDPVNDDSMAQVGFFNSI